MFNLRFVSVQQDNNYKRRFDQGCPDFCIRLYRLNLYKIIASYFSLLSYLDYSHLGS